MGVSFVISRKGKRYKRDFQSQRTEENENNNTNTNKEGGDALVIEKDRGAAGIDRIADDGNEAPDSESNVYEGLEASVWLNLFRDGYSVGQNFQNQLLPYDRAAEELFTAIENGRVPGDMFDYMPCKYYNGTMLCEVRDYRPHFTSMEGINNSTDKTPIILKVLLKLSMVNVVKDLPSIADATWTYKDLLEAESCILKALHPVLNLNPEAQLDNFFGASVKKVDLGITWNWKKRKLNESPVSDLVGRILSTSQGFGVGDAQNFSSESNVVNQAEGVPSMQQSSIEMTSVLNGSSSAMASVPSCSPSMIVTNTNSQLADKCSISAMDSLLTSIPTSNPQNEIPEVDPETLSPLIFGKRDRSGALASMRIHDGQRKENVGRSKAVNVGRTVGTAKVSALPKKSQRAAKPKIVKAEKTGVHDSLQWRSHLKNTPPINNIQGPVCEGNSQLQVDIPTCAKQEPDHARNCNSSNQSIPRQSQFPQPLPLLRASSPKTTSTVSPQSNVSQPIRKTQQNQIANKIVQRSPQLFSLQSSPHSSYTVLPADPTRSEILANNAHSKSLSLEVHNSLVESGHFNAANKCHSPAESRNLNEANSSRVSFVMSGDYPAEMTADPTFSRLSKIISVNERHQLSNKGAKMNQTLHKKSFLLPNKCIAFHLLDSGDCGLLENASAHGQLLSETFVDKKINISKKRTLTFLHFPRTPSGDADFSAIPDAQVKLVISEKLNEEFVEAKLYYKYRKEIESNGSLTLSTFSSSQAADLFASQFKSVMLHEEYRLQSDILETIPLQNNGGDSSKDLLLHTSSTAAATTDPIMEASVTWLLPYMSNPMSNSRSASNLRQLHGQGAFCGAGSLSSGDVQLTPLHSSNFGVAAEANIRYQQAQFLQNFGGHMQMDMDGGFGSSSNLAATPSPLGCYIPEVHNAGLSGNLPNNPVLGADNQLSFATSAWTAGAMRKQSENMRRALTRGFSHPGFFSSGMPMEMSNILNMPSDSSNPHQQQLQAYRQPARQLSSPLAAHFSLPGHPHPSQVSWHQASQLPQMNQMQLQSASVVQQNETGSDCLQPEILGRDSGNHIPMHRESSSSSINQSDSGGNVQATKSRRPG